MSNHLTPDQLASAIAGVELETEVRAHLEGCVTCRAEVAALENAIADRRAALRADEPDWEAQARRIMGSLPAPSVAGRSRRRWLRPALAAAAVAVMAVAAWVMRPDRPVQPPPEDVAVEEILAEMNALLADDDIPGFEIIDPENDDLETYFDNGAS